MHEVFKNFLFLGSSEMYFIKNQTNVPLKAKLFAIH